MTGRLVDGLRTLLTTALPGLFSGPGAIQLIVASDRLVIAGQSSDAAASEPRAADQLDSLPFDPANPAGPYQLTQPPYTGPRRVRLVDATGDRLSLTAAEVVWDASDARRFTLSLRPERLVATVTSVQVLYGVTAVYSALKGSVTLTVQLQASGPAVDRLDEAEALAVAVIELNRPAIISLSQAQYTGGDYQASTAYTSLALVSRTAPASGTRLLTLQADLELRVRRALDESEGQPIERIRTAGRPIEPGRRVDIQPELDV